MGLERAGGVKARSRPRAARGAPWSGPGGSQRMRNGGLAIIVEASAPQALTLALSRAVWRVPRRSRIDVNTRVESGLPFPRMKSSSLQGPYKVQVGHTGEVGFYQNAPGPSNIRRAFVPFCGPFDLPFRPFLGSPACVGPHRAKTTHRIHAYAGRARSGALPTFTRGVRQSPPRQ